MTTTIVAMQYKHTLAYISMTYCWEVLEDLAVLLFAVHEPPVGLVEEGVEVVQHGDLSL